MSTLPILIQFDDLHKYHSDVIGQNMVWLLAAHAKRIPITRSFCATAEFFRELLEHNNLTFEQIHDKLAFQDPQAIADHLHIPTDHAERFSDLYHHDLRHSTVHIQPSQIQKTQAQLQKGDTAVLHEVLRVWAHTAATSPHPENISILIHEAPTSDFTGVSYSQNPQTGQKNPSHECDEGNNLDETLRKKLDSIVRDIKLQHVFHVRIAWIIENGEILITNIRKLDTFEKSSTNSRSKTKIFASLSQHLIDNSASQTANYSGITHCTLPLLLGKTRLSHTDIQNINSNKEHYLYENSLDSLEELVHHMAAKSLYYTLSGTTRIDMLPQQSGGTLLALSQQKLLQLELRIIKAALFNKNTKLTIVVPFVRSQHELQAILTFIERAQKTFPRNCPIWLELATPHNMTAAAQLNTDAVSGFFISGDNILRLLQGLFLENEDLAERYELDYDLLAQKVIALNKSTQKKILLACNPQTKKQMQTVLSLDLEAITCKPAVAQQMKTCKME